jgi:hypothetical protein
MIARLKAYLKGDAERVTIEWIVLTAAVLSLVLSLLAFLSPALMKKGGALVDPALIAPKF